MKRNAHSRFAILAAASLLAMSSTVYAAGNGNRGGRDGNNGDRGHDRNANDIWRDHENGCAIGNDPPPGANCTNRDRNRQ